MIVYFDTSCIDAVTTPTNARAAIANLNAIITTLMSAAAAAALNGNMQEYQVDTGQTKTKVVYKDVKAITASIQALQALQQVYLQMPGMNNRVVRLMDRTNFVSFNYNGI